MDLADGRNMAFCLYSKPIALAFGRKAVHVVENVNDVAKHRGSSRFMAVIPGQRARQMQLSARFNF